MNRAQNTYLRKKPTAEAYLMGSPEYPGIRGKVSFIQLSDGVLVNARVHNLPEGGGFLAFHIHSGGRCAGTVDDPFKDALSHYSPSAQLHPNHSGDMPPLLVNGTNAYLSFVTGRFTVKEVVGKTVIVHGSPDDFKSQPSGDSGKKIACGVIKAV